MSHNFVKLTCTELDKSNMVCKYDLRIKATDIQVLVATELPLVNQPPLSVTFVWLPGGTRISVSETITEVERRIEEAL